MHLFSIQMKKCIVFLKALLYFQDTIVVLHVQLSMIYK